MVSAAKYETGGSNTVLAMIPEGFELDDGTEGGHRILRLRATVDHAALDAAKFTRPAVSIDVTDLVDADARLVGYSWGQFAMPVWGSASQPFDFAPTSTLWSPRVVLPLIAEAPAGGVTMLAPIDGVHGQVIVVDQTDSGVQRLQWGWHGNTAFLNAGDTISLGVFTSDGVADVMARWTDVLEPVRDRHRDETLLTQLSYWTDNGAAYWYRTEAGQTITESIVAKVHELDALGVTIGSVELDSWFYPHELQRPISDVGYLDDVPPTGMVEWRPRPEVFPDGIAAFREDVGGRPLVLHSRHISPTSPYLEHGDWWVDDTAHPVDQRFFDEWFADAASWGATTIEQDWMVAGWGSVRQLRAHPDRSADWLRGLDMAAERHDMGVLYCMASPADFIAAAQLPRVTAIRTCDDYRYAPDPAFLWRWFLTVNHLAHVVGVPAFKDCFFSSADCGDDAIDGDAHAEVEALLSALSNGPVGLGDRIGRTDVELVHKLCRDDGSLATADEPLRLHDSSFFDTADDAVVSWAHTRRGDLTYVVALHLATTTDAVSGTLDLTDDRLVLDWRAGTTSVISELTCTLARRGWALFVLASPDADPDVFGDRSRFVGI